jgi:hypothetical protein
MKERKIMQQKNTPRRGSRETVAERHHRLYARQLSLILAHPRLSANTKKAVRKILDNNFLLFGKHRFTAQNAIAIYPALAERMTRFHVLSVCGCIEAVVEGLGSERLMKQITREALDQTAN